MRSIIKKIMDKARPPSRWMQIKRLAVDWASGLKLASRWKRYGLALFYGVLAALAFPPFNLLPVLLVSFPALILILSGVSKKRSAFFVGWCFAFGFLVPSLYWIAGALFVDIKTYWWLVPFAVAGLPALFSIYYGIAALVAWRFFDLKKLNGIFAFALLWFAADVARGEMFTGFPWDVMGYAWSAYLPVLQITSVIGIYGLTLLTIMFACIPVALAFSKTIELKVSYKIIAISVALLIVSAVWGSWRIIQAHNDVVPGVRLRLVQSGIEQSHKWKAEDREANFQRLLDATFVSGDKPITHIVWPETATAFYLAEDISHRLAIASMLTENLKVITGAVQRQWRDDLGKTEYYNSLIVLDDKAHIIAGYDKFHLVPFGEYVPFRSDLPFNTTALVGSDFTAGSGISTLRLKDFPPFSPLVCYEAIFSGEVARKDDRPEALINVTNDGWYEGTIGPIQHFAISRVRSIEEGIPLVRVSNKGIVGVVDGYGIIRARLDSADIGYVDSDLPKPVVSKTIFSVQGNLIVVVTSLIMAFIIVFQKVIIMKKSPR